VSTRWNDELRPPALPAAPHACHAARRPGVGLTVLPAIGLALLPKCPICVAAYLGVLGSLGIGAWLRAAWLPLAAASLLVAIGALGVRARHRRGYGPLFLGMLAGATLFAGKFVFDPRPALVAAGAALLIAAAVWNTWPVRAR
jgi:mercuric ion transport protein